MNSRTNQPVSDAADAGESPARGATVPMWLIVFMVLLLYGGAVYFDQNGGWFSPLVYGPYRNIAEVQALGVQEVNAFDFGRAVYNKPTCVSCHEASGLGVPGQK